MATSTETQDFPASFFDLWFRSKTSILTTLVGWIPLPPGQMLRNFLYRIIFKQVGSPVRIRPHVKFTDARWLAIDDRATLEPQVCIDIPQMNDVYIGKSVKLHQGVRISCRGENGRVFLGEKVCLDRGVDVKVHYGGQMIIGDRTYIGPYTCMSGFGKIEIGKDCLIASHSSIYAHNHNFSNPNKKIAEQGFSIKGITIEDDCWLGSGVKVMDGVTIGKGSVIGAGAVVTKDIPPYSVAVGVPAKVISQRS